MIQEHRHPHPHIDPRQPRHAASPRTNPPVFAWKPIDDETNFRLRVARDPQFTDLALDQAGLVDPIYLPERAFAPGRYFWTWATQHDEAEVFTFEITPQAVTLEVPPAGEWLRHLGSEHPRIYIRPADLADLRQSRHTHRAELWRTLQAKADKLLAETHELSEPPFLPSKKKNYQEYFSVWSPIMWESRRFMRGAETLALAYLASGDARYARAACQRLVSVSHWNPEGSSHIRHNDEAHMSIIWRGPQVCDWVWEHFSEEERALVIQKFRQRGQITYDHVHNRGIYGITRFDSHSGREIVFLAQIALVFPEYIPEAQTWLDWLRPVLCGIWPIWSGDDGAWAEGPNYATTYVTIMSMFATTLKRGAGIDLYRRPFWQNHAHWRRYCVPPYAEWVGFSDCDVRKAGRWNAYADLVETIDRETGMRQFADYVQALRIEAAQLSITRDKEEPTMTPQRYLFATPEDRLSPNGSAPLLAVFPETGWAAIRTNLSDPQSDIAFIFRASPFGSISHAHANNNDFILHVAGNILAMPSGYYDGFGSDHHTHWVWHTKSHNCVTLSDAPQLMRSHDSRGALEHAFEDERLIYFRGNADASYSDRAACCRRHVCFLKAHQCFVLIDEFAALPGVKSALQWNIHSWAQFEVDNDHRSFRLERNGSTLTGHFMYHNNAFFSCSEGWDPPPAGIKPRDQWHQQYHLRFTASGLDATRNLGVVLCPVHADLTPPEVSTMRVKDIEMARIGEDLALVRQTDLLTYDDLHSSALALLIVQGERYEIGEQGIRMEEARR
ncbi:MAG: DUF4962 domain-containing protein [Chloroflexales bacterium]|nr:DUF4962 domain-containing protein [Chloroflexales bacterium]